MEELNNFLFEMGLTLEDVFEPDLNKQKEYHELLCQILDAKGEKQEELLNYAYDIMLIEKKASL